MTAIQTQVATFARKRSRAYVPSLDRCRGFWRFGKDAASSIRNLVPGAAQTGALVGAQTFGDNYMQLDTTAAGFNTGLLGGKQAFTIALMCTRPIVTTGTGVDTNGIYGGFHNGLPNQKANIGYVPAGAVGVIDFDTVATSATNQGQAYAMLFLTNPGGTGEGLSGIASAAGVAALPYTHALAANTAEQTFKIGLGQKNSGEAGGNPHSMKIHSAALFNAALDAAALADLYASLSTWATDVGLVAA